MSWSSRHVIVFLSFISLCLCSDAIVSSSEQLSENLQDSSGEFNTWEYTYDTTTKTLPSELEWVYQQYCKSKIANPRFYCDDEYGKVYIFVADRKDYESARKSCKELFKSLDAADLISFQDCREYERVQSMLMIIAQEDTTLWKEQDEELGMDIWTGTYEIPKTRRSVDYDVGRLDLSLLCKNESQGFINLTTTLDSSEDSRFFERVNFTANFVPWDNQEDDKRYPMCEFSFPEDFFEIDSQDALMVSHPHEHHGHKHHHKHEGYKDRNWSTDYFDWKRLPFIRDRDYFRKVDWKDRVERSRVIEEIIDQFDKNKYHERNIDPVNDADKVVQSIEEHQDNITASDILVTLDYFHHLHEKLIDDANVSEERALNFSKSVLKGFNIFLEKDEAWQEMQDNERTQTAINLLNRVQKLSYTVGCSMYDDHKIISDSNIQMETYRMQKGIVERNFMFPASHDPKSKESTGIHFTEDVPITETTACRQHLVSGVLYRKISSHMISTAVVNDVTLDDLKKVVKKQADINLKNRMNSHLLSFTLSDTNESVKLPKTAKIRLNFPHLSQLELGDETRCVFWDVNSDSWSDHKCYPVYDESSRKKTVCECDHLTNFAVLMDVSNRESNDRIKSLLTIICCAASTLGLLATVVVTVMVKSLRNRRSVITANLSLCLLVVNILVIVGFDQTDNIVVCRVISGVTLFALLSAFFWMLMEGYLLYQMIILVFQSIGYINTTTLYICGYTPSVVIVAIFMMVTGFEGLYDPEHSFFCWISNRHAPSRIWAFAGPAFVIIFINALILIKSFIAAVKSQESRRTPQSLRQTVSQTDSDRAMKLHVVQRWLKGWTSLFILVGLTWLIGLAYIHHAVFWFSYVFIVLNGLQGLFIFLFEIVFNGKTRSTLTRVIRGRLPRIDRLLSSSSSSFKNSSSNSNHVASLRSKTSLNMTTSSTSTGSSSLSCSSLLSKNKKKNSLTTSKGPPDLDNCNHSSCQSVVNSPLGADSTAHHVFHHQHMIPRLPLENFTEKSTSFDYNKNS